MTAAWPPRIEVAALGAERGRVAVLHGNGLCGAFYRPLADRLAARGVASVLFDLPGFAGAPAAPRPGWAGFLDAIEPAVREALGPDGVLVGHSLGGLTALLLAPRLPLQGLVLLEPAVVPWPWLGRVAAALYVRREFRGETGFRNRGGWYWRLHDPATFGAEWFALAAASHARADPAVVAGLHADLPSIYPLPFAAVTVPVVVVRGASSGRVMAWGQRDLVRRLPVARAVTVERAGHWLVNEQDQALAEVLVEALARHAAEKRPGSPGSSSGRSS